jgi:hypothetical protein
VLQDTREWKIGRRGEILNIGIWAHYGFTLLDVSASANLRAPLLHEVSPIDFAGSVGDAQYHVLHGHQDEGEAVPLEGWAAARLTARRQATRTAWGGARSLPHQQVRKQTNKWW